jgi:site-specific recombinase XerC
MMRDKVSKRTIDSLRQSARDAGKTIYLYDTEMRGFGALATKTGACSYFIELRFGGYTSPKRISLGKHGALTPEEARKLAKEELGKIALGTDVIQAKKDERTKLMGASFAQAVERYLSTHAKDTRYWKEKRARLQSSDVKPIAGKPLVLIQRADIAAIIDDVKARSHAAARLLFADIRPIFKWAVDRGLIDASPLADMKGPKPVDARDRVLEPHEIKALWDATAEMNWPFASIFRLLLLTGARREEVGGMLWAELDLDNALWVIPGARTKNGRPHRVPLTEQAVAMLDRVGIAAIKQGYGYEDCELVFSTIPAAPVAAHGASACLRLRLGAVALSSCRRTRRPARPPLGDVVLTDGPAAARLRRYARNGRCAVRNAWYARWCAHCDRAAHPLPR